MPFSAPRPFRWRQASVLVPTLIALLLAYVWERDLAFSKDFFTSSYVLLASGSGAVVLGMFYLFLDVAARPAPSSTLVRAEIGRAHV